MKKLLALLMAVALCLCLVACDEGSGTIESDIAEITEQGSIILDMDLGDLEDEGIVPGNEIKVKVGDYEALMLFNYEYLQGDGIEQMYGNVNDEKVELLIYNGNFAETYGITSDMVVTVTKIIQPKE